MKKVVVAGGGIIGLTTALYLADAGLEVLIIDKHDFLSNCSTGNAGLIVPSHFIPLASPGIVWQGMKWIFNPYSPFSMNFKPDFDLLKWGLEFWSSGTAKHLEKSAAVLLNINLLSKELYRDLAPRIPRMQFQEKGLLMLCRTEEKLDEEIKIADKAMQMGLEVDTLDMAALEKMETGTRIDVAGAISYKGDAMVSPQGLIRGLIDLLREKNIPMLSHTEFSDFIFRNNKVVGMKTNKGDIEFDELVIATGVFSQAFFRKLKIRAKVQAGKGYSFMHKAPPFLKTPALLVEARVAVTPYEAFTRFSGAMEIGGEDGLVNAHKVEGMVHSIRKYFPEIKLDIPGPEKVWSGLRPCSSDGLPYIGRIRSYPNVILATGHSMMGISLAPATAKIVEEVVMQKKPSVDISSFDPDR